MGSYTPRWNGSETPPPNKPMQNYKIRLSTLLKTLIEGGYLCYVNGELITTKLTDHLLNLHKISPNMLTQMSIEFKEEE